MALLRNQNMQQNSYYFAPTSLPLAYSASEYNTNYSRRGVAVIINNIVFKPQTHQKKRSGAEHDSKNLRETFKLLEFDVKEAENLTTTQMMKMVQGVANEDHTDRDCLVCVLSTHGDQDLVKTMPGSHKAQLSDFVYGIDGILFIRLLTQMFTDENCPSLAGKPKLFFIQACRGSLLAETVEVADGGAEDNTDGGPCIFTQELPIYKDFLLAYSAPPGYYSFRRGQGSWFITSLCNVLQTCHKDTDLLSMLTKVNHQITQDFESNTPRDAMTHQRKIVPWVTSMLTKDVFLRPKTAENERIVFV